MERPYLQNRTAVEFNAMHHLTLEMIENVARLESPDDEKEAARLNSAIILLHGLDGRDRLSRPQVDLHIGRPTQRIEKEMLDLLRGGMMKNQMLQNLYDRQKGLEPRHLNEPIHRNLLIFLRRLHDDLVDLTEP